MKNKPEEKEDFEFTSLEAIQESIFEKLAEEKILTLSKLVPMGFEFNSKFA